MRTHRHTIIRPRRPALLRPHPACSFALWLAISITLCATATAQPRLKIVGGETIDWGAVVPSVLTRTVRLASVGTDTLMIRGVFPSCGCTNAPLDKSVVPPGDTATIHVTMNVREYTGPQVKGMTIWTNDPSRGEVQMELRAVVGRDLAFDPEGFPMLRDVSVGEMYTAVITVHNIGLEPLVIDPPRFVSKKNDMHAPDSALVGFTMTTPYRLAPGESLQIDMAIRPTAPGTLYGDVVIATSSRTVPTFTSSLYCSAIAAAATAAGSDTQSR